MARNLIQPEQIYVVGHHREKGFLLGGKYYQKIPWAKLGKSFLYTTDEASLISLLIDSASSGYMILDGATSERQGLRGFSVAIGAWGWAGRVECRTVTSWCMEPAVVPGLIPGTPEWFEHVTVKMQSHLRDLVRRLNGEKTPFRPTSLKWLSSLYRRLGKPMEPDGEIAPPLPPDITMMCRRAHIGGPIVHVRTSLAPYVSLDRTRAYGEALLGDLPSGKPTEVDLNYRRMDQWSPAALMRAMGIAEATVHVEPGPLVPLLPVMRWQSAHQNTKTLHPTGTLRGHWTLSELAYLEESGRGHIEKLHRVIIFAKARPFAGLIRYIRRIEPDLKGIKVKRLEHMLYGQCAKGLMLSRMASSRSVLHPIPSDILDSRTLERMTTRVEVKKYGLPKGIAPTLPLFQVRGELSPGAPHGTMDRPDRSAWITSVNRVEMCRIIDRLDAALKPARSGDYIGRVYVDGLDIEATVDQIPNLPGVEVRRTGPKMQIYRANVYVSDMDDGSQFIEDAGLLDGGIPSQEDLEAKLTLKPDPDSGPLAGGRHWEHVVGHADPRMLLNQASHPLHLDLSFIKALGLSGVGQ